MNNQTEDEIIKIYQKKAQIFFEMKKSVHVKLKTGGWKNGEIKIISSDFFILNEFHENELPIFFLDIDRLELYTVNPTKPRMQPDKDKR